MSFKIKNCRLYIIALEHARERRDVISARLRQLGLPFEFIPAVDGRQLDLQTHPRYEPMKRRLFWGRDLSRGEFGCALAHRGVYQHMVDHEIARAVVLEDDAILSDELPAVIAALCRNPDLWDLVRFLGRPKNYRSARTLVPITGTSAVLSRPHSVPGGAYGYLLNLTAAKRLLAMMDKNWLAIDTLHGMTWLTGLKTLSVVPSPVLPNDDVPSCIDAQDANLRWDKRNKLTGWLRICYPATRLAWKIYVSICNKYVWLRTWPGDMRMRKSVVL